LNKGNKKQRYIFPSLNFKGMMTCETSNQICFYNHNIYFGDT